MCDNITITTGSLGYQHRHSVRSTRDYFANRRLKLNVSITFLIRRQWQLDCYFDPVDYAG